MRASRFVSLLFCIWFLFCISAAKSLAIEQTFNVTTEYTVRSQPVVRSPTVSTFIHQSTSENHANGTQKVGNSGFDQDEVSRHNQENNLSTKSVQYDISEYQIGDTFFDENDENNKGTNKIKNTVSDDFIVFPGDQSIDGCNGIHNSRKRYGVSTAAQLLVEMLGFGPNHLLNQFRCNDPYDSYIPVEAQSVYEQSITWTPQFFPWSKKPTNAYVQCVTFVFMSYELGGMPIEKKGRTNAADLLEDKYTGENGQFDKYHSGESTQLPEEGDIVVWSKRVMGNQYGHTGIILEVRADSLSTSNQDNLDQNGAYIQKFGTILVANANASEQVYEYRYRVDTKTSVVTLEKITTGWAKVPDFWLRRKSL